MTDATEQFLSVSHPFKPMRRLPNATFAGWSVRDRHGYDVCLCDDEDSAHAITETLNLNAAQLARKEIAG